MHIYDNELYANLDDLNVWFAKQILLISFIRSWRTSFLDRRVLVKCSTELVKKYSREIQLERVIIIRNKMKN